MPRLNQVENLVGRIFGRLTVIAPAGRKQQKGKKARWDYHWECLCACGASTVVMGQNLRQGRTLSCGCLRNERVAEVCQRMQAGMRFDMLVTIEKTSRPSYWLCECDCGALHVAHSSALFQGLSKSCGCVQRQRTAPLLALKPDARFGRWTVVRKIAQGRWLCRCDCGCERDVDAYLLSRGTSSSCGCFAREQRIRAKTTHGQAGTKLYKNLKARIGLERQFGLESVWTLEMEQALHEFFTCCVNCGRIDRLQVDHVRPIGKGFVLQPGNAAVLCIHCNSKKGQKDLVELPEEMAERIMSAAKEFKEFWSLCASVRSGDPCDVPHQMVPEQKLRLVNAMKANGEVVMNLLR